MSETYSRDEIIDLLKNSIVEDNFEMFYQPIFSKKENKFVLAEALLRMKDRKNNSYIYPNDFISIAEETELIIPITYQIIEKVCNFIRKLEEENIPIKSISINISPVQFKDKSFKEKLFKIMDDYHISYSKIELEITERIMLTDNKEFISFINEVHSQDINFLLDDFGTGYSNIISTINLPFDIIKIDRSLIKNSVTNNKCKNLTKSLINAFRENNIYVLAEGIEIEDELDFAKENDCHFYQGFYFAKPMNKIDTLKFFKDNIKKEI